MDQDAAKLARALGTIGADEAARAALLARLHEVERRLARPDFDVREQVTGPVVDALHAGLGPLCKRLSNGIEFHFHYRSKIARDFVMSPEPAPDHVWEPQTTKLLIHLGARARHVVIGGAYSGDQAILLARAMRDHGGQCHCFEPNADQMAMLKLNAAANGLDNLVFNEVGLWRSDGDRLVLVGEDSFAHPETARPGDPGAFPTVTIDSYGAARGLDTIGLIMLDIEGAELAALQGADRYLTQPADTAPRLVFEVHRHYVDWSDGLENTEIVRFLRSRGYHLFAVRDYQSNVPMHGEPIELIRPEHTYLEGPPHGFNMLAAKDRAELDGDAFRFCAGVSPKLLRHRDPRLHQPCG
ncbi:MAG: FkbM family methyltransferase [Rhodospirillaceae bacterium]|nr:FkbM family methyltransferase [Rhodospirillaceae bacterium]